MNPDEIRSMKPGPELDELVATMVMGYKKLDGHGEHEALWLTPSGEWLYHTPAFSLSYGLIWDVILYTMGAITQQIGMRYVVAEDCYQFECRGQGFMAPQLPEAAAKAILLYVLWRDKHER